MKSLDFDQSLKILGVLGAILSFGWGIWTWKENAEQERRAAAHEAARVAETRRVEATKPFLDRQLTLYTEASQVAAIIATSDRAPERQKAIDRFWRLYWGELALVEDRDVEAAMVAMGSALNASGSRDELRHLSLRLAHACRTSLDRSWGINAWARK